MSWSAATLMQMAALPDLPPRLAGGLLVWLERMAGFPAD